MSEICRKSSEGEKMSATALAEAHSLILQAAGEVGSVKERLHRAARALPELSFNRIRDLFYADQRIRVGSGELDYLRAHVGAKNLKAAQDEYRELVARVARLEALLCQDEDCYRPAVDALRSASRALHSPLDR